MGQLFLFNKLPSPYSPEPGVIDGKPLILFFLGRCVPPVLPAPFRFRVFWFLISFKTNPPPPRIPCELRLCPNLGIVKQGNSTFLYPPIPPVPLSFGPLCAPFLKTVAIAFAFVPGLSGISATELFCPPVRFEPFRTVPVNVLL